MIKLFPLIIDILWEEEEEEEEAKEKEKSKGVEAMKMIKIGYNKCDWITWRSKHISKASKNKTKMKSKRKRW